MQYQHLRALGTPRNLRYQRKIDHDEAAFRRGYLAYLATQDAAMNALVEQVQHSRYCLLCYEANAEECHRLLVANCAVELTGGALMVVHLSAAPMGTATTMEPAAFGPAPTCPYHSLVTTVQTGC